MTLLCIKWSSLVWTNIPYPVRISVILGQNQKNYFNYHATYDLISERKYGWISRFSGYRVSGYRILTVHHALSYLNDLTQISFDF
jgi:hypothetical protein